MQMLKIQESVTLKAENTQKLEIMTKIIITTIALIYDKNIINIVSVEDF